MRTIIGADSHSGWLPSGAARPLPAAPLEAILDVRIIERDGSYHLEWEAHDAAQWSLQSARGTKECESLRDAEIMADRLFGVQAAHWTLARDDGRIAAADVEQLAAEVLGAYDVTNPAAEGWGTLVVPPRLAEFQLDNGASTSLWLIFDSADPGSYVVFYDGESGSYGLGSRNESGGYAYIGDYGPLWTTLVGM